MVRSLTLCVGSGAVYLLLVFDRLPFFVFLFELFFCFQFKGKFVCFHFACSLSFSVYSVPVVSSIASTLITALLRE